MSVLLSYVGPDQCLMLVIPEIRTWGSRECKWDWTGIFGLDSVKST